MKRVYISIIAMLGLIAGLNSCVFSQTSSTYLFFKPIYSFPANISMLDQYTQTTQGITYQTGIYGSYAEGVALQAGIGKMINSNLGVELGAEWHNGHKETTIEAHDDEFSVVGKSRQNLRAILVKPMLLLRNSGDLLTIYSKLGLAVSVYSQRLTTLSFSATGNNKDEVIEAESKDKIKAKVGYAAAFGLSFRVSKAVAITTELNGQMLTLPVSKGHFTKYLVNGKDQLPSLPVSDKSWVYEKQSSTTQQSPDGPGVKLYQPANYSYIGLSVGLIYYL